ncbi:MAG TPA: HAMP domain-containing sensor histidine kinase [Saprospiraceae bacterium]|nr:HAMP domain-containing sensor histidine kinase [Saprospiraceae bacterium]
MELYAKKSRWKWYLAIAGVVIVAISMVFTQYLTSKLSQEERNKVALWAMAIEQINDPELPLDYDLTLHLQIQQTNTTIPIILVNDRGGIDDAINFGPEKDTSKTFLKKELEKLKASGIEPIEAAEGVKVYYKKSELLRLLEIFPIFQLALISIFIMVGYFAFSSARRAEQNRVWVGMAKETAHQLGTPISAIIGWIDHLRELKADDEETQEVMNELRSDVTRLELVADRFSKIGSAPELEPANVFDELEKSRAYMARRAPRKVVFEFPGIEHAPLTILINAHLFHWVLENLLRNALDAMDGSGKITAVVHEGADYVEIDISDTGKGIHPSKFKTVFQPGYTTKKRGWGLGLSLARRIVEEYHKGKIFVKSSDTHGTTFSIRLPKG